MDSRNEILARNLINYSCALKKGERILIECGGIDGLELAGLLVKEAYRAGGLPFVKIAAEDIDREILMGLTPEHVRLMAGLDCARMAEMQAYIGLRAVSNTNEFADVPPDISVMYSKLYTTPVHMNLRVKRTKWVVLRYPNASMAQLAGMSREAFSDYFYRVCNLDYSKMAKAVEPLKALCERTDKVRITSGSGTDLTFSIKGIPSIPCVGTLNIPDGEIFTAPVKHSVNGLISYNAPSYRDGFVFENIKFEFRDGKIVNAKANDTERLNKVLDTDEGARYIGEFALGLNPYITKPMKDTLFDEKIMGSFHLTPGNCYDEAPNGNQSAVHWDLVCIQTPEYGGGEIYFDGVLVRKDGLFVLEELDGLNPQNLM
ncbi:MAG: aminopeptidase [Clostridiales bacterium]|jgi:aminopeptidase|nr:aminopeptidase [Clostridiales bacterium]